MTTSSTLKKVNLDAIEAELKASVWQAIEAVEYQCCSRVLETFRCHKVGEEHFSSVTGYGHDDMGRQVTDKVFADVFQAEAAIVRMQFFSGTHAITVALRGCLRAGDTMVSVTGPPYDTFEEVIGKRGDNPQSFKNCGIHYEEIDCFGSGEPAIAKEDEYVIQKSKVAFIQRSRGYALRPSLTIPKIEALCKQLKAINTDIIIMVDNCYGEFTQTSEPTAVGADLIAGSLIKNPGGGIVPTGGYIAGREDLIESCAEILTAPGIGSKGGYTFDLTRTILQGLYLSPSMVANALKSMTLAARLFSDRGYETMPTYNGERSDIIQVICFGDADKLIRFCRLLQQHSPVASNVTPEPAHVPGYGDKVIMAGGTFVDGATLELSADGALREPYAAFLQGGLSYAHSRNALEACLNKLEL